MHYDVRLLSISKLIDMARQHDALYRAGSAEFDPAYGYELWRRAIVDGCELSWSAACDVYAFQVRKWIFIASKNDYIPIDDLVCDTFAKFWRSARIDNMSTLGAVLMYLKKSALSARADFVRRQTAAERQNQDQIERMEFVSGPRSVEDSVISAEIQQRVALVLALASNDRERAVLNGMLRGLKSAEIAKRCSSFKNTTHVYRTKENFIKRARRVLT